MISAEILLERLGGQQLRSIWPLVERWEKPGDTLAGTELSSTRSPAGSNARTRAERLLEIAERLADTPDGSGQRPDDPYSACGAQRHLPT